jgi:hypothetical protein
MTDTAAPLTVVQALSDVMDDVQSVSKTQRNQTQNYNFRGIDAVVNAVGPALRKHGVIVVPVNAEWSDERYATSKGSQMRGVTITVTFRFYGPAGDFIDAQACGESADSGDKAVPKAHSVAFRTLLLQALCIPTDEPDPDALSHERGAGGALASAEDDKAAKKACVTLCEGDTSLAAALYQDVIKQAGGMLTESAAQALVLAARATLAPPAVEAPEVL